jgi:hypothetical protein
MSEEKFRGNENWLEEYLPLKWGGLRVFLCGLVYLLGLSLSFIYCSLDYNDRLSEEEPGIIAVLITSALLWTGITIISVINFMMEATEPGHFTRFPWAYLQKYWRNNVISPKIVFSSVNDGTIRVNTNKDGYFLIRKSQETYKGNYGSREEFIQFTIRCGGWFWRRNTKGWCNGRYVDFSDAIKSRSCHAIYCFRYASSPMRFEFGDFDELMDFWHSNVSNSPKNSLKKYGELTIKVTELEAELEKFRELIREKDMHISEFGRYMLEIYQVIAISIAESSRLAINRESSNLLRKLLAMGMDMRDPLRHEFEHDPLKVDPRTNASLKEIFKLCEHYLKYIDEVARKTAKEKETKPKPVTGNPPADNLPAQQNPPA